MRLDAWKRILSSAAVALLVPSVLGFGSTRARAEDEQVLHRLNKYGKLSAGEAKRLADNVTSRMKRAADMASANDPLRMAVSTALVGTPSPADAMGAAKVRLRLYAGLNQWALDNLFAPKSGAMATCTGQYGLAQHDCQALLAAAGSVSLAEAAKLGGGGAAAPMAAGGFGQPAGGGFGQPAGSYGYTPPPAPVAYGRPPAAGFGQQPQYGGGYQAQGYGMQPRYGAQPAYGAAPRPAYAAQPAYAAPRPAYGAPAAQPGWAARPQPMQPARPMVTAAPPPNPAMVANRKAEYERQRQAYLDRKRQEMEQRKTKIMSATDGAERVQRGPSSEEEAAVAGLPPEAANKQAAAPARTTGKAAPAAPAPAAKGAKGAPAVAAADEAPAEAPAPAPAAGGKAALDNDFLSGLMDDPLGKK